MSKSNPSNPLAFKSCISSLQCPSLQLLCSICSITEKNNVSWYLHEFLSTNSYLCLPYHTVLWEVQNLGSFLNLIIWYFPTIVCLLLTCQISFCSHIFCVCLLDTDNSGWCKSLSAFDSENVIKKENTKEQPHVLAIQAYIQLLYQTNIGRNVGCMLQLSLTGIKDRHQWQGTARLWQMCEGINYWNKARESGLMRVCVWLLGTIISRMCPFVLRYLWLQNNSIFLT